MLCLRWNNNLWLETSEEEFWCTHEYAHPTTTIHCWDQEYFACSIIATTYDQIVILLWGINSIYKGCMTFQLSFQSSQLSHHWEVSNYYCRIPHNYVLICTTANYLTSIVVPTYFQNCILMSFQKSVIVTFSIYVPQKYICIHSSSCQVLSIRRKTNCVYCILFNENKNSKSLYVRLVLNWEPSNSMCEEARQDRPICN